MSFTSLKSDFNVYSPCCGFFKMVHFTQSDAIRMASPIQLVSLVCAIVCVSGKWLLTIWGPTQLLLHPVPTHSYCCAFLHAVTGSIPASESSNATNSFMVPSWICPFCLAGVKRHTTYACIEPALL